MGCQPEVQEQQQGWQDWLWPWISTVLNAWWLPVLACVVLGLPPAAAFAATTATTTAATAAACVALLQRDA